MTNKTKVNLPYFDHLLSFLKTNDSEIEKSFGRHVHWGYWEQPKQAELTTDDFANAAEKLSDLLCRAVKIKNQQTILDVGCGFGGTIAHLNENHTGLKLLGLNLDERQLQRARTQVQPIGNNQIQFQQGNACSLPFPDHSFDVVMAVECIFHFPSRETFFREAFRVLKPGGSLVLSDFVPTSVLQPLMKLMPSGDSNIGFYGNCNVQCTSAGYKSLAKLTGFIPKLEQDITANTLPTYRYLRSTGLKKRKIIIRAIIETLTLEILSRTRLLKYLVLSFQKP